MAKRLYMTSADYVAIAISPALVMMLVGSLVFFLIEVLYVGDYQARLTYAFGLFVFAAVLIARIAIEMGSERAAVFALALGVAMFLVLAKFVDYQSPWSAVINIGLMSVVWWCAHKLTWDCTLIDDSEDASGEGLMQRIGVDGPEPSDTERAATATAATTANELLEGDDGRGGEQPPWWQRMFSTHKGPHTPGLWVLYFSLAALPIFGFGQHWIPASDTAGRRYAFALLFAYVMSGLALLVTTSFLGLRRYLRQRRVEMPNPMAATWVATGAALILLIMLVSLLVPRPAAEVAVSRVPWPAKSPERLSASRVSGGGEGADQPGEANHAVEDANRGDATPGDERGQAGPKSDDADESETQQVDQGEGQGTSGEGGEGEPSDSQGGEHQDEAGEGQSSDDASSEAHEPSGSKGGESPDGQHARNVQHNRDESQTDSAERGASQTAEAQPPDEAQPADRTSQAAQQPASESTSQPSEAPQATRAMEMIASLFGSLANVLKLLFYAVLAAIAGYLFWKYRHELMQALREILRDLAGLLARLFGGERAVQQAAAESAAPAARLPRFDDFKDPFATGAYRQLAPEELVRHTFAAFEAWANDHGCPRTPDRTPQELVHEAVSPQDPLHAEARHMVQMYGELAYAGRKVSRETAAGLRTLWNLMRDAPATTSSRGDRLSHRR